MTPSSPSFSYSRYLAAKQTVDERSLNGHVWRTFLDAVQHLDSDPLRVLEVGGGVGNMVQRILSAPLPPRMHYTLVDRRSENVEMARERLSQWAKCHGFGIEPQPDGTLVLERAESSLLLEMVVADLYDVAAREQASWDAIIGQALLDLLDLGEALPLLLSVLREGGVYYFPITFDGMTRLLPTEDGHLDERIERLYHEAMGDGEKAGSKLFEALPECGGRIEAAGSSDWIVRPTGGAYPEDEAYVLHCMLHFLEQELSDHPRLDANRFRRWMHARRRQIEEGRLVLLAHQLDFVGHVDSGSRTLR